MERGRILQYYIDEVKLYEMCVICRKRSLYRIVLQETVEER